ncbi:MAG: ATP-dependent RecD-like DNA helicase [Bacilli bacterium]|nr:ATP-dependent RecD-like DNA helicase [Bacilli bacterium]
MENYIKGNYKRSIFSSEKGYIIGLFKIKETNIEEMQEYINRTITFTGYFHELTTDDTYIFFGEPVNHPKYGFQFNVSNYERVKPEGKEAIIEFLSSDLFPGIGINHAKAIVHTLGDNALDEILINKANLNLVPKLSAKKADKIYTILKKYEQSHETIVYLTEIGFSMRDSMIIYNKYKNMCIDIIKTNIYKIPYDINEITFLKVDTISPKLNYDKRDKRRIKAAIIYIMNNLIYQNGDTYLTKEMIVYGVNQYLEAEIDADNYDEYFKELEEENKIKIDNEDYYLKEMWEAENNIIDKLYIIANKETQKNDLDNIIKTQEEENKIIYNDQQKQAITKAINNNIVIITGGPGTGKTTIIKAITNAYQKLNNLTREELINEIALLAPTGRASKRMAESTLLPASTIHRFLKWDKDSNQFMVNEYNKDKSKLIIIDEASMIDVNLFDSLFKGLTTNIKLILVGDYNQLPSVGPGQILKDLIESDTIDTIHLDLLYRQDENSYIPYLAEEIKEGCLSESFLETKSDYTFLECQSDSIKNNLKKISTQLINKGYDYRRVQLLAPMYKGINGIDNLNKELQEIFNPEEKNKRQIKYGDVIFRENDKILQLINQPDDNVFNGDIGVIKYIKYGNTSKSGKNELYIDFDSNLVKYTSKDFANIKHGFIISIHKSQGSEFELVMIPICKEYSRMLYRKLIYTAVTRAKRKLILIGEPMAFSKSVYNTNEYKRNTKFLEKITYKFNNFG